MKSRWTTADMPSQDGRLAVVTGSNSGLGLETARALALKGAKVVMACRTPAKAEAAAEDIRRSAPGADIEIMQLDVANQASIRQFAESYAASHDRLDLLINNAGVMGCPTRTLTTDGFEMQFGTNHLGPFALTGLLLPVLEHTPGSRVIAVASIAHRNTDGMNLDDPNFERSPYKAFDAYAKSKLANVLFTHELSKRLRASGSQVIAASGHPGYSASNIGTAANPNNSPFKTLMFKLGNLMAMPANKGMLSILCAATDAEIAGGDFIGPKGPLGFWGWPHKAMPEATGRDDAVAERLWEISASLTGVSYLS